MHSSLHRSRCMCVRLGTRDCDGKWVTYKQIMVENRWKRRKMENTRQPRFHVLLSFFLLFSPVYCTTCYIRKSIWSISLFFFLCSVRWVNERAEFRHGMQKFGTHFEMNTQIIHIAYNNNCKMHAHCRMFTVTTIFLIRVNWKSRKFQKSNAHRDIVRSRMFQQTNDVITVHYSTLLEFQRAANT